MAYFTTDELKGAGYISGTPVDVVAAPDLGARGLGFSITDVLGGIGGVVGSLFGGGSKPANQDQAQIAMMLAQQQQQAAAAAQASQTTILQIGLAGLAVIAISVAYLSKRK